MSSTFIPIFRSISRVYTIDTATGEAVAVGAPFTPTLSGTEFGVDFNPTVDRIRVVSDSGQNLRINPDTGVAINDTPLAFGTGDRNAGRTPRVIAAAYTNSFAGATATTSCVLGLCAKLLPYTNSFAGATATTLYNIDSKLDALLIQNPANAGTLSTVGMLGLNTSDLVGFDIGGSNNNALAVFQSQGSMMGRLYRITLDTGQAQELGLVGEGESIRGIALAISAVAGTAFSCGGKAATIIGINGNDTLIGTEGDDVIVGLDQFALG